MTPSMRIGAIIPNTGELPRGFGVARMARAAEEAGADSVWVSDHLLMVDVDHADYPYSPDGRPTWSVDTEYYEAFVCLAAMAMHTRRCRVGTAVLVLPQRNVLEVAKVAASLDHLSGGRLALGVGAGWNRTEMEALGYRHATRGRRFDEMLEVLRECWTGRPREFAGEEVRIPANVVISPRPAQPHGPPLLVGGMTPPAIRRAARLGDGWMALAFTESWDEAALQRLLDSALEWRGDEQGAGRPFETVLKLHAQAAHAGEQPALAAAAQRMGFGEVIIEPPWSLGMDAVREVLAATRSAAGLSDEPARAIVPRGEL
jgi:probable F420-dependent oxidoreductase